MDWDRLDWLDWLTLILASAFVLMILSWIITGHYTNKHDGDKE